MSGLILTPRALSAKHPGAYIAALEHIAMVRAGFGIELALAYAFVDEVAAQIVVESDDPLMPLGSFSVPLARVLH
jgi:hypothetical protein